MKRVIIIAASVLLFSACADQVLVSDLELAYYSEQDFDRVRKIDSHVHANIESPIFLDIARESNFEILSINVDYPDFPSIDQQADIAQKLHTQYPEDFHFAATFSMQGFGGEDWVTSTNDRLGAAVKKGASAVKVWKNVGMVERDDNGDRIFLNDPRFSGLMAYLDDNNIPLIAHQGEPRNCWLPLDEMTTNNDRLYFSSHPEYYMYLHPEEPRYEQLMSIRDKVVKANPNLSVVGAHLASLEWSVDEIGQFLDANPNATVDLAARMSEVQNQGNANYEKVRDFFIKYQDRILYGSDLTHNPQSEEIREQNPPVADDFAAQADTVWRADWRYLTTEKSQFVNALQANSVGLNLPVTVIDKIYHGNAVRVFSLADVSVEK